MYFWVYILYIHTHVCTFYSQIVVEETKIAEIKRKEVEHHLNKYFADIKYVLYRLKASQSVFKGMYSNSL